MANNEDTLFREVEEELRRERVQELWNRYGTYFLIAAVAVVAGVWSGRFYFDRQQATAAAAGAAYDEALDFVSKSKPAEAVTAFEKLAGSGPAGYAALAKMQLAAAHLKAGEKAKAAEALQSLADSQSADQTLRQIASLQLAMLKIGDGAFTEAENRLNDLAADTSPWRANARELIAVAALKQGKLDAARSALELVLADPTAPAGVRSRVQVLLGTIVANDLAKAASATATAAPTAAPDAPRGATPGGQTPVGDKK